MKIRAAVLNEIGGERPYTSSKPIEICAVELDPPGAGELLVRIEAAGVCHSDLSVVDGNRPRPTPMVLGHEAAGVVEAVGEGVVDVEAGDHVVLTFVPSCGSCDECQAGKPALCSLAAVSNGDGTMLRGGRRLHRDGEEVNHHLGVSGFAEYAVVDRGSAVVIPSDVPLDIAALMGCGVLTGWGAVVNSARARPGQSIAVVGLGAVGLSAVMGAVASGLGPVVAIDPIDHKRALAVDLGADEALASTDEAPEAGFDIVVEASGIAPVLASAFAITRRGGTTVAVGLPHPDSSVTVPALAFAGMGKRLIGSYMGDAAPRRDVPGLIQMWRRGLLPVEKLLTHTRTLDDVNLSFEALADGTAIRQVIQPHRS